MTRTFADISSRSVMSGGCEIRTREGVTPTRFPSVRTRPLCESSAGKNTGAQDPPHPSDHAGPATPPHSDHAVAAVPGGLARLAHRPLVRRHPAELPQGRK